MIIHYREDAALEAEQLAELFRNSGIRRPTEDLGRLRLMIDNSNLIVTAWHEGRLVGIARALTDFSWCCYLSDLAVDLDYQRRGIGRELVRLVGARTGEMCSLILNSAPGAMEYYPKIGLEAIENGWMIKRAR